MHFVVQGAGLPFTSRMSGVPVRRALGPQGQSVRESKENLSPLPGPGKYYNSGRAGRKYQSH